MLIVTTIHFQLHRDCLIMSAPHIVQLALRIASNTTKVSDYLVANNLPQPSFDLNTPLHGAVPKDEPEIQALRQSVLADTAELRDLMLGPRDYLLSFVHNSLLPQQAVTRFGLARNLPVGSETSFAEMAKSSGLSESNVRKLVRCAVAQRIFEEPRPGVVAHSAASRLLAEDPGVHDFVATCSDELWQAAAQTCNAMAKYPGSEEPTETGFSLANNTDKPMYEFLSDYPERSSRFANMMRSFTEGRPFDLKYVTDFYPWEEHSRGTVVDVGGSQGFVCVALARKFSSMSFVVQDLEPVITEAKENVPPDVASRVSFMTYDFFTPQPVSGADVYFFRWIFHNWSDKYSIKILRNLIPALKPGAKIVVSDAVLPGPGEMPKGMEVRMRSFDLVMTSIQNAKERELSDWAELFQNADERFEFVGATCPPGSNLSLLVAVWKGS
ncbi:S-adenosyl-L-methionine-dependent methyltransferase [Annulohypoxylon truncatum]|uniref:S-adenosyl-L-methionine-dependent methyltransferase n=1 Tax=Annulohypoxylon truncatum TaxID=327061 RepID=UPI0020087C46|nr:S-adenosyl-L-methionine-dependent methyltransferase [Annulohypoxylon truncatum]KAI1208033.1 S-adenosyl-L-methionine-dependent methyltransferase [Annulohypoxylon truncatum]